MTSGPNSSVVVLGSNPWSRVDINDYITVPLMSYGSSVTCLQRSLDSNGLKKLLLANGIKPAPRGLQNNQSKTRVNGIYAKM